MTETWVFGHGSLMFRPGFDSADVRWGRVDGLERRFGHPSIRNWGTPAAPAPTCCLIPGSSVDGLVFRLGSAADAILERIRLRESGTPAVVEVSVEGRRIRAFTWTMDGRWAGSSPDALARHASVNVARGGGPSGDAADYLRGVAGALEEGPGLDPATAAYAAAFRTGTGRF